MRRIDRNELPDRDLRSHALARHVEAKSLGEGTAAPGIVRSGPRWAALFALADD